MLLHALLRSFDAQLSVNGLPNVEITGVCEDSRRVQSGNLFIARAGEKTNGAQFIADAKARGAVACVVAKKIAGAALPQMVFADPARATGLLANLYHGSPSHKMRCLAVTGTNGKT